MEGRNWEEVKGESTREGIRQMSKSSFHHEYHFIDEFVDLDEVLSQTLPQIEEAVKVIEQQKGADHTSSDEAQEGKKKKRMEKENGEKKMKNRVCIPSSSQRNEIEGDSKNVHRCEIIGINIAETCKGTQKPLISHHTEASSVEARVRKNELLRQTLPQFEEAVKVIKQRRGADQITSNDALEGHRKKGMEKENGKKKMKNRVCTASLSQRNEIEGNSKNVQRCEIIGVNVAEIYNGIQKPLTPYHTEASSVDAQVRINELLRQTLPHTEDAVKVIKQQKVVDQISLDEAQEGQKRKKLEMESGKKKMKKRVSTPSFLSQRNEIEGDSINVHRCEIIGVNVAETYNGTQKPLTLHHTEASSVEAQVRTNELLRQAFPQIEEAVKVTEQQKGADQVSSDETQEGKKKKIMEKENGKRKMKKRVCTPSLSQRNEIEDDSKNVHRCGIIRVNVAETYNGTQKPLIPHHTEASSGEAQVRINELPRQALPQIAVAVKVIEQQKRADQMSSDEAQEGEKKKRMEKENVKKKMKKRLCTLSLSQSNEIEGNSKNVHRCESTRVNVAETYNGTQKLLTSHHTEASSVQAQVRKNELLRQTLPHIEEAVTVIEQQKGADQISSGEAQEGQKKKRMEKENGKKKMKKRLCTPSISQKNEIEGDSKNVYRCKIIGVDVAETYNGTQKPLTSHHAEASSVKAQVRKNELLRQTLPQIEEAVKVIEQQKVADQISSDEAQEAQKKKRMEKENGKKKMKKRECTPYVSQNNEIECDSKNVHRCEIMRINVAETYNGTEKPLPPHHTEASPVEGQVSKNEHPKKKRKMDSKGLQALSPPERKRFEPRSVILSREGSDQVLGGNGSQPIMPNGNQSKVLTPNDIWELNHQYFLMEASLQMLAFMEDLYIAILHNFKAAIKQTHH